MAQQTLLPPEPAPGTSPPQQTPPSPTKSLWKRILNRNANASAEPPSTALTGPQPQLSSSSAPKPDTSAVNASSGEGVSHDAPANALSTASAAGPPPNSSTESGNAAPKPNSSRRAPHRDVVPGIPRALTFARQQSELRENLLAVKPSPGERRATSRDHRLMQSASSVASPENPSSPRASAPDIPNCQPKASPDALAMDVDNAFEVVPAVPPAPSAPSTSTPSLASLKLQRSTGDLSVISNELRSDAHAGDDRIKADGPELPPGLVNGDHGGYFDGHDSQPDVALARLADKEGSLVDTASMTSSQYEQKIRYELEHIWILNLSMHFRDKSKREKFFITYRQRPDLWRRVTISLDYRNAPEGSLETDLLTTKYQRDKNEKIYEAIRESLVDIQFYNTVTNLKLETKDGQLHVHVVEDANEIINYPTARMVQHLRCRRIRDRDIEFDSHMSGFVYKVRVDGRMLIKKEIPGPGTVDEFLYEVNALSFLSQSHSVIEFFGIIVDDDNLVKGLLIDFAEQGALIDIIYDNDGTIPWNVRLKWAHQIVLGLSEIHEAGFVQGDFTLSNIVIDDNGDAKIIDINRRGCPVGWEPPEATPLIENSQSISMYIGVKSDLYQLGMVLWALVMQDDEPEARGRPLHLSNDVDVPSWFRIVVETCLDEDPRGRAQARQLLRLFPKHMDGTSDSSSDNASDVDITINNSTDVAPKLADHSLRLSSSMIDSGQGSMLQSVGTDSLVGGVTHEGSGDAHVNGVHERRADTRTGAPPSDWAYADFGHKYVDAATGLSNEPYFYPTRGRSPPYTMSRNSGFGSSMYMSNYPKKQPSTAASSVVAVVDEDEKTITLPRAISALDAGTVAAETANGPDQPAGTEAELEKGVGISSEAGRASSSPALACVALESQDEAAMQISQSMGDGEKDGEKSEFVNSLGQAVSEQLLQKNGPDRKTSDE